MKAETGSQVHIAVVLSVLQSRTQDHKIKWKLIQRYLK